MKTSGQGSGGRGQQDQADGVRLCEGCMEMRHPANYPVGAKVCNVCTSNCAPTVRAISAAVGDTEEERAMGRGGNHGQQKACPTCGRMLWPAGYVKHVPACRGTGKEPQSGRAAERQREEQTAVARVRRPEPVVTMFRRVSALAPVTTPETVSDLRALIVAKQQELATTLRVIDALAPVRGEAA